jgi:hypothetical protein
MSRLLANRRTGAFAELPGRSSLSAARATQNDESDHDRSAKVQRAQFQTGSPPACPVRGRRPPHRGAAQERHSVVYVQCTPGVFKRVRGA